MPKIRSRILLLLTCCTLTCYAQTDTEFWFIAPEVKQLDTNNMDRPIYLRITSFDYPAQVIISQPANLNFIPIELNVPSHGFATVDLTPYIDVIENQPPNEVLNHGVHILSSSSISVYYEIASTYCFCNPELFTLKGKNSLGLDFMIPTQNHFDNATAFYFPRPYNSFDIVATQNNTTINITPSHDINGHQAGVPFQIKLNRGQSYSAVATSELAINHLYGSIVSSNKPIAITQSDDLLNSGICQDVIGDQIIPIDIIGTEYIAIRGNLSNDGNRAFILASEDNTNIYIDGNATPIKTLNKAETYNYDLLNLSSYIRADKPVYVFQTSGFGCELGGALLPAIRCSGSTTTTFSRTTDQNLGVLLMTQNGNQDKFLLNGDPNLIPESSFSIVPGTNGEWVVASLIYPLSQIPVGTTVVISNLSGKFHMGLLIGGETGGCSYGYFSDFSGLYLGPDIMTCPNSLINIEAGTNKDSYVWNTGDTTQSIAVTEPGIYSVTVNDAGCQLSDTLSIEWISNPIIDLGTDTLFRISNQDILLEPISGIYSDYLWSTGSMMPSVTVDDQGVYWLLVHDENGCMASDTIYVKNSLNYIWFPNAFTPNGDGKNDLFKPTANNISTFQMFVFNRWGLLLFQTENIELGWNGFYLGKICPGGVYVFKATYETIDTGQRSSISGYFTLIQ